MGPIATGDEALKRIPPEYTMATRPVRRTLPGLAFLVSGITSGIAHAQAIPIVTGEQWVHSSDDVKKAYCVGISNLLAIERAFYASRPQPENQEIAPRFAKGMQGQTLDGVRQKLDAWHAANPAQLQHPVIETIWAEMSSPA